MFSFFEYLPMQYRQATEREWQIRKMIWSFKDGKSYLNVAWMIANKLHQVFGDDVKISSNTKIFLPRKKSLSNSITCTF